ncbi:DUF1937 family protein [Rhodoplanes roseus]|nr:DUF1937 family protein [Rhodoplanes roseus]
MTRPKSPWHLAPLAAFRAIVDVLGHGAGKHDAGARVGFRAGRAWSRDFGAAMRHLTAWWLRDGADPQSGRSHLQHAAARLAILAECEILGLGQDDRPGAAPPAGAASREPERKLPGDFALCYVATPYSKFPGGLDAAFMAAARITGDLARRGVRVFSPIAHSHPIAVHAEIDPLDHAFWLPFDAPMMAAADALIVVRLPGWDSSVGVRHEIDAFTAAGKPIWWCNPDTGALWQRNGA